LETMEAMLLWSKSQMEHFAPQKKIILVQSLFEFLQKQFSVSGISFQDPGQLMVSSDEDYLKTIMYNLTANAVKALANTENPQIAWKARQNGNQVELSITDNGPGVHEEQLDALYNENAVVGTRHGLGLHLIRDLAKAINCRVLHQPGFEKGSVFQIIM
jgi:C4-dicarboxylate-specific signal transduction histidine kinase